MSTDQHIHQVLVENFGFSSFRPGQKEIILDSLNGKDVIALLPTGGGKSLCYQVPALSKDGVCLVISPLIALMKDQVANLRKRGIIAEALVSGMGKNDLDRLLDNAVYGNVKFLYLSPERLKSELVRERIKRMNINLVAIDEAHCVSQWGYDFRPPYLDIAEIREWLPDTPFMALTASATTKVMKDLEEKLQLRSPAIHKRSFFRSNLRLSVQWTHHSEQSVLNCLKDHPGTAILYVRSRKQTTQIATRLAAMGISAISYHAGLTRSERDERQAMWMADDVRVMVATNAFGMGIDKPDVRLVIHLELPDSPEAYYQEAGRAGRDGEPAEAIMILRKSAAQDLKSKVEGQFPEIEHTRRVYTALANQMQIALGSGMGVFAGVDLPAFCRKYELQERPTYLSLLLLERYGLIRLSEGFKPRSFVHITLSSRELYAFEVQNPRFAPLIKQMLRWYGGLLTGPTPIDERSLGASVQIPDSSIEKQLKTLEGMGVLVYQPAISGQGIEWTLPRTESKYLPINQKEVLKLKEEALRRANAMIYLAEHEEDCRFSMLLAYFGEEMGECGLCDNCSKRNPSKARSSRPDKDVLSALKNSPLSLEELEESLPNIELRTLRKLIGDFLDEGIIQRDESGVYSIVSK